jgi:UDP-N-acetylglucosamine--N-acetylmuramyl-(pentapeptide) pyrophosphoryl-undecaprenol N-acetylglucosamine transferase
MERFFPEENIVFTGNPVRQNLLTPSMTYHEAIAHFGLEEKKRTVLIVGGSLGARTINDSVLTCLELIRQQDEVQFIWQTGSFYKNEIADTLRRAGKPENLIVTDFIADMAAAYTVADLVISRAGAGSISEFCLLGKPVILVPSPNVAEDHQTKNALALVKKGAAVYIKDDEARQALIPRAIALVQEPLQLKELSDNILPLAKPNAAMDIAREVLKLAQS